MKSSSTVETIQLPAARPADAPPEPVSTRVLVDVAGRSHAGLVRPNNEDSYLVARLGRTLVTVATNLPDGDVPEVFGEVAYGIVVADGVGGGQAGEVAGRKAIASLVNLVLAAPDWIMRVGNDEAEQILDRIADRFRTVCAVVAERAEGEAGLAGMGTTLTVAYSLGPDLFLGHVGDSRAYLLRGGVLTQLTRDHTVAQALADLGHISPDEVAGHHMRHVLTRAVGKQCGKTEADVSRVRLADGDRLLVCTDGLHDLVPAAAIAELLGRAATADAACEALVAAALASGGKDNVTAAVACYRVPVAA